jgi:hypothetical protein
MLFRYRHVSAKQPVYALGGRFVRPRPLVDYGIVGPRSVAIGEGLLDTGSDDTVFPESVAQAIGVDLSIAQPGLASGVGRLPIPVRYSQVLLRLSDGRESREWPAIVGFTATRLYRPLLGFAGCLQFFTSKFEGDLDQVELTANRLYPGTQRRAPKRVIH